MKRFISLILLIGSFAGAMDAPLMEKLEQKETISSDENWFEELDEKDDSRVPSLKNLCTIQAQKQFGNMSLEKFLAANQPVLPHELDSLVGSQILAQHPEIAGAILQQIEFGQMHNFIELSFCSPDRSQNLTGSYNGPARLRDCNSGKCLWTCTGHTALVRSVAFSRDGTQILTGSYDGTAKLWDRNSGKCLMTFGGHKSLVRSVDFSRNGTQILTGSYDGTAKLWDCNSGQCITTFESKSAILSVDFSPNDTQMLTRSCDCTAKIWDCNSGKCLKTFQTLPDSLWGNKLFIESNLFWSWERPETFNVCNFLISHITINQTLLLKDWYTEKQKNRKIDLSNPQIQKVFESLPQEIKEIIKPNIITRIKNYCYNNPWQTVAAVCASALAGYGLWKYFKSDN